MTKHEVMEACLQFDSLSYQRLIRLFYDAFPKPATKP
jgi:hypothetical protein